MKQIIVALDIGNVCVELHPERFQQITGITDVFQVPAAVRECWVKMERGLVSRDDWVRVFHESLQTHVSSSELISAQNSILGDSMPGMADAVRDFSFRGVRFIYFSNTSKMHMDTFFSSNDFSHLVTGCVFSYSAGSMKPEPEIYESFEKLYGVPDMYFDDRQENIDAAVRRNWNGVLFTSAEMFRNTVDEYLKNM